MTREINLYDEEVQTYDNCVILLCRFTVRGKVYIIYINRQGFGKYPVLDGLNPYII